MAVKITGVWPGSPARRARIHKGDTLISINGNAITDVLDYRFYMTDETLEILLCDEQRKLRTVLVEKDEYDDLGLEFETYLMDRQMGCKNKCIFCFVDQTPPGMRQSLYFKDDDTRMSFLFGNYTTLTNLKESDIQRIIKMHISPINISVHTMNPELRVKMMKNPFAGKALDFIRMLTEGGIKVNTQMVLCPGYNDGEELEYSLSELAKLGPNIQSIAAVPVGLTRYREGLEPLRGFFPEEARQVVSVLERWGDHFAEQYGTRMAYASDEFYILAGLPFPDYAFYEDFAQLENGVGMMTLMQHDFGQALEEQQEQHPKPRKITVATGELAFPMMERFAKEVGERYPGAEVQVKKIVNDFFGHSITVAGLVTGQDLLAQLDGVELGEELLIPANMLRHEQDKFLDDVTLEQVRERLGVPVTPVENDGFELLSRMLGR
jgi:putative radical SAM enzyme (TIGR03279 family)